MLIKNIQPNESLQEFVRNYQIISWKYDLHSVPQDKFLAPRPEHSLTFYIRDSQSFCFLGSKIKQQYPKSIVSGIQTHTLIRDCGYDFWAIKIIFQPCALFRLTGFPMNEFIDNFVDAQAIFGNDVDLLYYRLNGTDNLDEMINQIEGFLLKLILKKKKDTHILDLVSLQMLNQNVSQSLQSLAHKSYLSTRQFIRKFEERTGLNPKLYSKIVRFDKAYRLKNSEPNLDWLSISLECGYYDYQHLVKDYKEFTNNTPVSFYEIDQKAPERDFGLYFS